jgi:hypothetical protein
VIRWPEGQPPLPQEVFVVEPQLLQAGPRHVGELDLGFLRSSRRLAPFGNILHPTARRLHHLVAGSAPAVDVSLAEPYRNVVDQLRQLEALQLPVTAVLRNQRLIDPHALSLLEAVSNSVDGIVPGVTVAGRANLAV